MHQITKGFDLGVTDRQVEILVGLSPRRREIAQMLATGATFADIALKLGISESTVKNHVFQIGRLLCAGSSIKIAAVALVAEHRQARRAA